MLLQEIGAAKHHALNPVAETILRPFRRLALLAILGVAACGPGASREATVTDAWVRLPAVPGRPGAAYFTITGGAEPGRLVTVEGAAARRIELHRSGMSGGRMTMRRLDGVDLAPGATVRFAPEGDHAMLFDIPATLKPGDTTRLDFRFERGMATSVEAKVVAAGDDAPH